MGKQASDITVISILDDDFSGLMLGIYFSSKVFNFAKSLSTALASSANS